MIPALGVGILGPAIGIIHSLFARSYQLETFYKSDVDGAEKRRILILIWHLPSLVWSALALAILAARFSQTNNALVTLLALFVFTISDAGNLWAHRKPFIGGLLLMLVAVLVACDWLMNT
jgi:hypothetical protein